MKLRLYYDEDTSYESEEELKEELERELENLDFIDSVKEFSKVIHTAQAPEVVVDVEHDWDYNSKQVKGKITQNLDFVDHTKVVG